MKKVKKTERGWAGHYICAMDCKFRRNTLLEYKDAKIVVSTVGAMTRDGVFQHISYNRCYETMAFHSDLSDTRYYDADVKREIQINSETAIDSIDADDIANEMHETAVEELTNRLINGEFFNITNEV